MLTKMADAMTKTAAFRRREVDGIGAKLIVD